VDSLLPTQATATAFLLLAAKEVYPALLPHPESYTRVRYSG